MLHLYVRNAQEKSCCGIASMQTSFLHPACPFLQKIQSSLTLMYLEPRKGHVITSCCQEHSAFFCQHRFTTCRLNCQFFCWPLTACQSLYHVLLPPICSSPLSHLSSVHPFKCRACLQIPRTGPHGGFCLHSQQSDIYPPNSLNHLKMDPEHPKADT